MKRVVDAEKFKAKFLIFKANEKNAFKNALNFQGQTRSGFLIIKNFSMVLVFLI